MGRDLMFYIPPKMEDFFSSERYLWQTLYVFPTTAGEVYAVEGRIGGGTGDVRYTLISKPFRDKPQEP